MRSDLLRSPVFARGSQAGLCFVMGPRPGMLLALGFLLEAGFVTVSQLAVHSAASSSFGTGCGNVMMKNAGVRLKGTAAVGDALHEREGQGCG